MEQKQQDELLKLKKHENELLAEIESDHVKESNLLLEQSEQIALLKKEHAMELNKKDNDFENDMDQLKKENETRNNELISALEQNYVLKFQTMEKNNQALHNQMNVLQQEHHQCPELSNQLIIDLTAKHENEMQSSLKNNQELQELHTTEMAKALEAMNDKEKEHKQVLKDLENIRTANEKERNNFQAAAKKATATATTTAASMVEDVNALQLQVQQLQHENDAMVVDKENLNNDNKQRKIKFEQLSEKYSTMIENNTVINEKGKNEMKHVLENHKEEMKHLQLQHETETANATAKMDLLKKELEEIKNTNATMKTDKEALATKCQQIEKTLIKEQENHQELIKKVSDTESNHQKVLLNVKQDYDSKIEHETEQTNRTINRFTSRINIADATIKRLMENNKNSNNNNNNSQSADSDFIRSNNSSNSSNGDDSKGGGASVASVASPNSSSTASDKWDKVRDSVRSNLTVVDSGIIAHSDGGAGALSAMPSSSDEDEEDDENMNFNVEGSSSDEDR